MDWVTVVEPREAEVCEQGKGWREGNSEGLYCFLEDCGYGLWRVSVCKAMRCGAAVRLFRRLLSSPRGALLWALPGPEWRAGELKPDKQHAGKLRPLGQLIGDRGEEGLSVGPLGRQSVCY